MAWVERKHAMGYSEVGNSYQIQEGELTMVELDMALIIIVYTSSRFDNSSNALVILGWDFNIYSHNRTIRLTGIHSVGIAS
jgi:hypothetical protein